jgi:hypothetical protein
MVGSETSLSLESLKPIPDVTLCFVREFILDKSGYHRAYNSGRFFQGTMIVAVVAVQMVQVPTHQIIHVVAMRRALVPAIGAMGVLAAVRFAVMLRRAVVRVRFTYRNEVFVNVIAVHMMQMAIMEIVDMPVMTDLHVAADSTVLVIVGGVCSAFRVLHTSSFLTE